MTYTETDLVATIEALTAEPLSRLTRAEADRIDQFHAGGTEAVDRMVGGLGLVPGTTVLDVGSGLGGPARQVARTTGATVVGVDITPAYVEVARALTDAADLSAQVSFVCSDLAELVPSDFDAAYTMHVQMNVADKAAFFGRIGRHLRPGARLAVFEVCRAGTDTGALPLPWTLDGTDSYLVTADELLTTIQAGGFEPVEWVDETGWTREWFGNVARGMAQTPTTATLSALLEDGPRRLVNFAAGVFNDIFTLYRGTFVRTA
jgi:sarcosine/dimethylglycine N-methyltransferase